MVCIKTVVSIINRWTESSMWISHLYTTLQCWLPLIVQSMPNCSHHTLCVSVQIICKCFWKSKIKFYLSLLPTLSPSLVIIMIKLLLKSNKTCSKYSCWIHDMDMYVILSRYLICYVPKAQNKSSILVFLSLSLVNW